MAPHNPSKMAFVSRQLTPDDAYNGAMIAVARAQKLSPKLSGMAARSIEPVYGPGFFGLTWEVPYLWYQNEGVRPFLMRNLAGRVIPMWIDDPTGSVAEKNPKAQRRVTESGRPQVLIFRKAAPIGSRKTVKRKGPGGKIIEVDVPRSYPGAAGRIANREAPTPYTTAGRLGGRIAQGNIGIRWYFPGLSPRYFLQESLRQAAAELGVKGSLRYGFNLSAPADYSKP